jgi:hypothetical protein
MSLVNAQEIEEILFEIVKTAYEQIKDEAMLLYIDQGEINILVATDANDEFEDAIKANFLLDEDGDIIDQEGYYQLLRELQAALIDTYKTCGLFNFFPAGTYDVNGETLHQG